VVLLLVLAALVVLVLVMVSLVGQRREEVRRLPVDDAVASLARELETWLQDGDDGPTRPGDDEHAVPVADSGPAEHRAVSLADLLEPVQFPEDLLPLTHGMNPTDLHFRLVLSTRRGPSAVRQWLDTELHQAGFDVRWDDDVSGTARRPHGAVRVLLHPPVSREQVKADLPPDRRRRRRREPVLKRPDFPSAPFEATVVELLLQP
jgi:hypothetical protein